MSLIYLDYNCFQRSFDDLCKVKIKMEAIACQWIFSLVEKENIDLVWSFMHEDENVICPFFDRKIEVLRLSKLCKIKIDVNDQIYKEAKEFQVKGSLSSKDAIHLSCANYANSDYLLTCDEKFRKRAKKRLNLNIRILNPIDYVKKEQKWEN